MKKPSLSKTLSSARKPAPPPKTSLWKGPEVDGITYSMLSRFLVCRERFRVAYVEGLQPADAFNHRMEYGQMWHVCEESLLAPVSTKGMVKPHRVEWEGPLETYARVLTRRYPQSQEQIVHWMNVCSVQFRAYVDAWARDDGMGGWRMTEPEKVFDTVYVLPSGRNVRLRGKVDAIWASEKKPLAHLIQENKTKGDIDPELLRRQLTFDLQSMMYVVGTQALGYKTREVMYNIVRRPLSGGRHSIRQHAPTKGNPRGESSAEFYKRLGGLIASDTEYFFQRWAVPVREVDVGKFRAECLDPILEQVSDWWGWISKTVSPFDYDPHHGYGACHWRHPFGVWNALDEGGATDLDAYLADGSTAGLQRKDRLFEELG